MIRVDHALLSGLAAALIVAVGMTGYEALCGHLRDVAEGFYLFVLLLGLLTTILTPGAGIVAALWNQQMAFEDAVRRFRSPTP